MNYNEINALRSTQIKALASGGPRELWEVTYGEKESTPSMQLGTMSHLKALQPEKWNKEVLVEAIDRRTKEGKARAAEVEAKGLIVVKPEEAEKICAMATEWNKAAKLILGDEFKTEEIVTATVNGVNVKAQIDAINYTKRIIVDMKSISDVSQAYREIWKRRYDLQMGFYVNDLNKCVEGGDEWSTYLVFVETSSPFRYKVFDLTNILPASRKIAGDMTVKADCCLKEYGTELKNWPQPGIAVITEYPDWISEMEKD